MSDENAGAPRMIDVACPDDETLVALVEHALPAGRLAELESHVDSCPHCRQVIASLATAAGPLAAGTLPRAEHGGDLASGTPIGERYRIERALGRGGMGTVYLARDLTLGRDVAVKVHRAPTGHERLYQEALAMARLAHPNVVAVFEIGVVDGRRFVAMEYVKGGTSRDWLREDRTWREIVELFAEAGEGIVAAHRAGMVHRDFKPENVLVGEDGRPRVSDFGLVQEQGQRGVAAPDVPALESLTETGTIVGTPAYMAPEQLAGAIVDGRCDQFAFCVSVWEALYKTRPYAGATTTDIQESIQRGELKPARGDVPARVRRVLERGLAARPEDRFPDMVALLAALRRVTRPRTWLKVAAGVGVLAIVGAGVWFGTRAVHEHRFEANCTSEAEHVRGLYTPAAQTAIVQAFAETKSSLAQQSAERAGKVLDRYATTLATHTRTACETPVPPPLGDARMRCLHDRAAELENLVHAFEHPTTEIVVNAPASAWSLSDPAPCDDPRVLFSSSPKLEPAQRATLAQARISVLTGRYDEGVAALEPLLAAARKSGDRVSELVAIHDLAQIRLDTGPPAKAKLLLNDELALAEELGDDYSAAAALGALASIAADEERNFVDAHRDIDLARAKLARLGGKDQHLDGLLGAQEGRVLSDELRLAEAETVLRKADAILERVYGPDHPQVARVLGTLCQTIMAQGREAEGLPVITRVIEILQRTLGDEHYELAGALMTRAQSLIGMERYDEARADLKRADAMFAKVMGEDHPSRGGVQFVLGQLEEGQKHAEPALAAFRQELAIYTKAYGPDSGYVASCRRDIADALEMEGRYAEALVENQQGLATFERILAKDDAELAPSLEGVARDLVALHRSREAIPLIERSIALTTAKGGFEPAQLTTRQGVLATALWDVGDHARAKLVITKANAMPGEHIDHAWLNAWLHDHP